MEAPSNNAIMLRLRDLSQLFNSMDPSPFFERDLDADAEEFIMSWARELPAGRELELVIHMTQNSALDPTSGVEDAVRRYFASRAEIKRREFRQLLRRGRLSLAVGVVFLVTCLLLGQLITASGPLAGIVTEGLTICGWVAMWRPLEIYLYDWWPLYEDTRRLDRLARMRVRLVIPSTAPAEQEEGAKRAVA